MYRLNNNKSKYTVMQYGVTIDGVLYNSIYWPLTGRNYK
jgi:hypothetical protein